MKGKVHVMKITRGAGQTSGVGGAARVTSGASTAIPRRPKLRLIERGFVANEYEPHCPLCGGVLFAEATVYVRMPLRLTVTKSGGRMLSWGTDPLDTWPEIADAARAADDLTDDPEQVRCFHCDYATTVGDVTRDE